jgi:RNA ligase
MTQNPIQAFLRAEGAVEELGRVFGLTIKRHPKYNNLVQFKYDQIESQPESHPIVVNARGLILDQEKNWEIVCWPFNRFFNYGSPNASVIDFSRASILTKLDGSCLLMWYYRGEWHVSTTGSPAAEGGVGDFPFTFADLFWKTFRDMRLETPINTNLTYMWELTSPFNKIVVRYMEPSLTLIGVRDKTSGEELAPKYFTAYPQVKLHSFNNVEEIMASLAHIPASEMEGVVARSFSRDEYGSFKRLKIKSEQYLRHHRIKGSWSLGNALEIVLANEQEEVKIGCPEYTSTLDDIEHRLNSLIEEINKNYNELKHISIQKDFALAVQTKKCIRPDAMYGLRTGYIKSLRQYFTNVPRDGLMKVLGLKNDTSS